MDNMSSVAGQQYLNSLVGTLTEREINTVLMLAKAGALMAIINSGENFMIAKELVRVFSTQTISELLDRACEGLDADKLFGYVSKLSMVIEQDLGGQMMQ